MSTSSTPSSPVNHVPVSAGVVVNEFDLISLVSGNASPLDNDTLLTDQGSESANQAAAAATFVGRAVGKRTGTEGIGGLLAVASGVVEYPCDSETFVYGGLIAPCENGAGDALEAQKVKGTSTAANAIGRCVEAGTNLTKVKVQLMPFTDVIS